MLVCRRIDKKSLELSHQDPFPEDCRCVKCGKIARFVLVAYEGSYEDRYISHSRPPHNTYFWPHDAVAFAIYFCIDYKSK